jgi:hypothetical protein
MPNTGRFLFLRFRKQEDEMLKNLLLALSAASVAFANTACAAEFNAILSKLGKPISATAQIDVSLESTNGAQTPIDVTVQRADGTRDDFQILTNDDGFATTASTKDLFAAAAGQDALVQIRTPVGVEASTALLRQKLGKEKILVALPVAQRVGIPVGANTHFSIALGDVGRGSFLLIANVTVGQAAEVSVHVGSGVFPARFTNPELGVYHTWRVPLTAAEARKHVVVRSTVPVSVQLVIDDGKVDEAAIVAS